MAPHFLLTFGTTTGHTRTIRVNNPNTNVTSANVRTGMNTIISSQTLVGPNGRANSMRRALLIETQVTPIAMLG